MKNKNPIPVKGKNAMLTKKAREAKLRRLIQAFQDAGRMEYSVGDRVMLNVDRIMQSQEYASMQPKYREFVESNRDTVFTVANYKAQHDGDIRVVALKEEPTWLFWAGDLISLPGVKKKKRESAKTDTHTG